MHRIIASVPFLVLFLLVLTSCGQNEIITERIEGGAIVLHNIDELAAMSTHIVKAEIISSRGESININLSDDSAFNLYMIHTIYSLKITDVYYGNVAIGDIIEVKQMGGKYDNRVLIVSGVYTPLSDDDELIFFLHCFYESRGVQLPIAITSPFQGVFRPGGSYGYDDVALDTVSDMAEFHLNLTIGDLERIAEAYFGSTTPPVPLKTCRDEAAARYCTEYEALAVDTNPIR